MQSTATDRDDDAADAIHYVPRPDDSKLSDSFELWDDLGGSD